MSIARAWRVFIAAYPDPDARAQIAQLAQNLIAGRTGARPVAPDAVHLTIQFVGTVPTREVEGIAESVRRSASGIPAFSLRGARVGTLPARGEARLLALMVDAPPPLMELKRRLAHRLGRSPRAKSAEGFMPHLTLVRFAPGHAQRVEADRGEEGVEPVEMGIDEVRIVRSILRPKGAEHVVIERVPLGSGG